MSKTQYKDGHKEIPSIYKTSQDENIQTCPGQCTCDMGIRSSYDRMQYDIYVKKQLNVMPKIVPSNVSGILGWKS